jgi:hypothetical protein
MTTLTIPSGPDALTPEWLTDALRAKGCIGTAAVTSFTTETIAAGVGLLGQLARMTVHYDGDGVGAPRTMIAKFPSPAPENRFIVNLFRFHEREVRFYEEVAGDISLRTPRCYYSAVDIASGDYVILLEDLAPARVGDQLLSCTLEEAELAIGGGTLDLSNERGVALMTAFAQRSAAAILDLNAGEMLPR